MKLLSLVALAIVGVLIGDNARAQDDLRFEQTVGPLLTKRCAGCHDANEKKGGLDLTDRTAILTGGDSGPALVPGQVDDSLLWQRVADGEMPPKSPLPEAERAIIKDWIARGAPWSGGKLDPLAFTSEHRAGYDWWSLEPLCAIAPPELSDRAVNPIDAFIERRLSSAGLTPSPEADARTLIRRLYVKLLGLLPESEEVEAFVSAYSRTPAPPHPRAGSVGVREHGSAGEKAYFKLVDKLLSSHAYGERWARHWLDVARFGESQGFERDKLRSNAWRYRDWVIDAFNRDLPYDEFARLQLAGDVLLPGDADALIATGFLVAGPWDEVGQKQQSAAMKVVVRQDELEDLVGTVGQTFLGLTVNCARCHDHKFDPIRQSEYYRLTAALGGVHHGEPKLPADALAACAAALRQPFEARQRQVQSRLAEIETPHRQRALAARKLEASKIELPKPIAAWEFNRDARDTVGELHVELHGGPFLSNGLLLLEAQGYAATPPLKQDLRAKTLEAWVQLVDLTQRGGGLLGVQTLDGDKFDTIVFGERQPRRWLAGSDHFRRSQDVAGAEDERSVAGAQFIHVAVTYQADGTIAVYRQGRPYGKPYQGSAPQTFAAGESQFIFGVRHTPPQDGRLLRCAIDRARVYDRALTPEEVAASAGVASDAVPESELIAAMSESDRSERTNLIFETAQLKDALARVEETGVYAVGAQQPAAAHVLHRGNPNDPREIALPGGIASLRGTTADFGLTPESTDGDRRRKLADWIASRDNPLFARVMVNRLWHYHFGVGLVDTPNDFGFNGGRPSHPDLLDWLAGELIRSGWSIKHVQQLIVTSATFRQSSRLNAAAMKIDAGNRLLWRMTPERLEAETLRDVLLQLSGGLDRSLHGPGFQEFTTFVRNSQFYDMRDAVGPTFQRRTIYRTWVRSARSHLLDVFDCPDPSTKTPQRAVTTTPLQALALLNNSFVLRMADDFAARVRKEAGDDAKSQVARVFRYAFGREPSDDESSACESLVREHGLPALCRVSFNANELLFVD